LIAALRSPRAPDDVMMMVMMIKPVIEITGYPGPREIASPTPASALDDDKD
jgi:hypothetical protein